MEEVWLRSTKPGGTWSQSYCCVAQSFIRAGCSVAATPVPDIGRARHEACAAVGLEYDSLELAQAGGSSAKQPTSSQLSGKGLLLLRQSFTFGRGN